MARSSAAIGLVMLAACVMVRIHASWMELHERTVMARRVEGFPALACRWFQVVVVVVVVIPQFERVVPRQSR